MHIDLLAKDALYCVLIKSRPFFRSSVVKGRDVAETARQAETFAVGSVPELHVPVELLNGQTVAVWFDPTRPELRRAYKDRSQPVTAHLPDAVPMPPRQPSYLDDAVAAPLAQLSNLAWTTHP